MPRSRSQFSAARCKRGKNGLVVYRLEQAKIAGLVAMGFEMEVIDLRADAPDRYAVAPCQPETGLAMIEERVPAPVEQPMHVTTQRRDPVRIIAMEAIGQVDKAIAVAPAAERGHLDRATFRRFPLGRGAGIGGIWRAGSGSAIHQHRSEDAASLEIRPAAADPMLFEVGPYWKTGDSKKWLVPRPC